MTKLWAVHINIIFFLFFHWKRKMQFITLFVLIFYANQGNPCSQELPSYICNNNTLMTSFCSDLGDCFHYSDNECVCYPCSSICSNRKTWKSCKKFCPRLFQEIEFSEENSYNVSFTEKYILSRTKAEYIIIIYIFTFVTIWVFLFAAFSIAKYFC